MARQYEGTPLEAVYDIEAPTVAAQQCGLSEKALERLSLEIAVDMEIHAAMSTTTAAKAEAIAAAIRAYLEAATPPDVAGQRCDDALISSISLLRALGGDDEVVRVAIEELEFVRSHQAATALRLSAGGGVPEGWKLVPVEPTEEMIGAGDEVMYGRYGCSFEVTPIYKAMLAASPTVEAGHVE